MLRRGELRRGVLRRGVLDEGGLHHLWYDCVRRGVELVGLHKGYYYYERSGVSLSLL